MDFVLEKSGQEYAYGFSELLTERGYSCQSGISVSMELKQEDRITVRCDGTSAVITAGKKAFLFRGLMTLVMHVEKNAETPFYLEEETHFEQNGTMLDCSRNCVMSLPAAKAWIRMQAAVGMNILMLYTEDTYEVPGYPYFGALRGKYKKEELQELDQYARSFGIDLIPCIQTLGHLQQPLLWESMRGLRDTGDILMVGNEEVYRFIRACLQQISRCFTTKKVHLGMDEAWTLGLGRYLIRNGYRDKDKIMKEHLAKVMELCEEFGLEPMIWSDMYFRVHSETEDYYNVPFDTDMRTRELPPEKTALVYWDYYHTDEEYYRAYIRLHRQITDHVIFAGGGWTWNGTVPNLKAGYAVLRAGLNACRKEQVRDVFCTLWGDDGTETPLFSGLGPVLFCAEYGFGTVPEKERIMEKYEFLTGCSFETYSVIGDFDIWTDEVRQESLNANPSKNFFYQDVMLGIYDGQMEGECVGDYYAKLAERMQDSAACARTENMHKNVDLCLQEQRNTGNGASQTLSYGFWGQEMKRILEYYRVCAQTLSLKADLGLRLRSAYADGDRTKMRKIQTEEIPEAIRLVELCRQLREKLWMEEGKIFGWEVLDIRFRALGGRLESSAGRIGSYLDGTLDSLPELEEDRLPALPSRTGEERLCGEYNSWINTVSASPLAWGWLPQ